MNMSMKSMAVNILTLKWGNKYGPEYVNQLYRCVQRNLRRQFRFVCFTDDPAGISNGVDIQPLVELDVPQPWQRTPWLKLALFEDGLADLRGPALFLDLDIVITGPLNDLFDWQPGARFIIRDWDRWHQRISRRHGLPGNSSVFRFEAGKSGDVLEKFYSEKDAALSRYRVLSAQRYLTEAMGRPLWWPQDWIVSFKRNCIPPVPLNYYRVSKVPNQARIVVFHGHPNPHEAIAGYRSWRPHRTTLPTPWIEEIWRLIENVQPSDRLERAAGVESVQQLDESKRSSS